MKFIKETITCLLIFTLFIFLLSVTASIKDKSITEIINGKRIMHGGIKQ